MEIKILIEALEKIANPIQFLQKEAEKNGGSLCGITAIEISNNANWLKEIAKKALIDFKK